MFRFPHIVVSSFLVSAASVFAAWDGTSVLPKTVAEGYKDVYEITTPEELVGFRQLADTSFALLYARLKNDIIFGKDTSSLSEIPWIQNDLSLRQNFIVEFDGAGHTIYGFNSDMPLFTSVNTYEDGARIANVTLANCKVGSDTLTAAGGFMISHGGNTLENIEVRNCDIQSKGITGGVAGYHSYNNSHESIMRNVRSVNNRISGSIKVGGVVGYAYAPLTNAFNSSEIVVNDSTASELSNSITYVGGIVGDYTPYESDGDFTLDSMVNEGDITVKSSGNVDVGGIAGESYRSIVYGKNAGKITVEGNLHFATVGGIVGYMNKSWKSGQTSLGNGSKKLYNFGAVKVTSVDSVRVGGIVGDSRDGAFLSAMNFGDVDATSTAEFGVNYVGGVLGYAFNNDENALAYQVGNRGEIKSNSLSDHYVGGVAGALEANGSYVMDATFMQQAFNYGNVTAKSESAGDKYSRFEIGGIVGYANFIKMENVYNRGEVVADSPERQYQYVGGLAGKIYYIYSELNYGYSATSKLEGKSVGGLIGSMRTILGTKHLYLDSLLLDGELASEVVLQEYDEVDELAGLHKSYTGAMQNDEFLAVLNGGSEADKKIWIRRDGYPVFDFDTLMVYVPTQKDPVTNPDDDFPMDSPLRIAEKNLQKPSSSKYSVVSSGAKALVMKKNNASGRIYTVLGRQIENFK